MKKKLDLLFERIFYTPKPLTAGIYSSMIDIEEKPHRVHLRIENDGTGMLVLDASTVLHLNETATEIAYYMVSDLEDEEIIAQLVKRYQVSQPIAAQDVEDFEDRVETLLRTPDLDPETFLDMERVVRHSADTSTPFRLDCAITYQIPSGGADEYTPAKRVDRLLTTEEWKEIIRKAWDWGIPHLVFTGGEPTLRPDLGELVQYAEELGQVTGLITNGFRLTEKDYLKSLLESGLDHLMLIFQDNEELSWEAIKDSVQEDIHLSVHLTLSRSITENLSEIMDRLVSVGVQNISLSAPAPVNETVLATASRLAAEKGLRLIYDLPVPYSELNPVNFELEEDQTALKGAARSWVYVEPDGDVLPGQGYLNKLGNFLTDPWMVISANRKIYLAG